jgi:hypothetical protein
LPSSTSYAQRKRARVASAVPTHAPAQSPRAIARTKKERKNKVKLRLFLDRRSFIFKNLLQKSKVSAKILIKLIKNKYIIPKGETK